MRWRGDGLPQSYLTRFGRDAFAALSGAILDELSSAPSADPAAEEWAAHERFRLGRIA